MGISGLWKVITPVGDPKSLFVYSTAMKAQLKAAGDDRTIYFGVDMRPLMAECTAAASATTVNGRWAGDEIYILFNKLASYLKCPVTFIFVFDGPGRPGIKRGHRVVQKEPRWTKRSQELIKYFGYYCHQAPGEAEAELAALNDLGLIDAVLTSDSDALVFGAKTLLRVVPKSKKKFDDETILFTANSVSNIGLTKGGLLLFALLCEGDYGPGIKGCGSAFAYALAQCGFGDQLLHALGNLRNDQLQMFLLDWRASLRHELITNSQGKLHQSQPRLASQIPDTFPDPQTLNQYQSPLTSWSAPSSIIPDTERWVAKEPNLSNLVKFCSHNFDWTDEAEVKRKFSSRIWEGAVLQAMYSKYALYDHSQRRMATPSTSVTVISLEYKRRKGSYAAMMGPEPQPRLLVSASTLVQSMGPTFHPDSDATVVVWATKSLLPRMLQSGGFKKSTKSAKLGAADLDTNLRGSTSTRHLGHIDLTEAADEQNESEEGNSRGEGPSLQMRHLGYLDLTLSDDEADGHWKSATKGKAVEVIDLVSD